jgi:plasmid replication initiation protein
MPRPSSPPGQLDLFVSLAGDVPLRDDREAMSVPLVSLSKSKRTKPIEWRSSDGTRWVRVTAPTQHGLATIWDYDIILWAISQLNAAVEAGLPTSPVVHCQPHDMLKAIGRDVGGRDYNDLEAALRRLKGTVVETNIRQSAKSKRAAMFGLLDDWAHDTDPTTGRSRGLTITVPRWMYQAVVDGREVLAVSPSYFDITSGIGRWLYRLARRHAGRQQTGWRFTMTELHARSGSAQPRAQFARDVRRVITANNLPEYAFAIIEGQRGHEVVTMIRDPAKPSLPQRRDLRRIGLPTAPRSGDGHGGSPTKKHGGSPTGTRGFTHRTPKKN